MNNIQKEILYYANDLLSFVDDKYAYRFVNEAYSRTWNRPVEDFIGHSVCWAVMYSTKR